MRKGQRKGADCSFKKLGAAYPEEVKKKIVGEIQWGFQGNSHQLQPDCKVVEHQFFGEKS